MNNYLPDEHKSHLTVAMVTINALIVCKLHPKMNSDKTTQESRETLLSNMKESAH